MRGKKNALANGVRERTAPKYIERIVIDRKGKWRAVSVVEIDYILAAGYCAELHVGEDRFIVREPLHRLERRLDPRAFMRIHQSSIIRLDRVSEFFPADSGDHEIVLTNGTRLPVGRSRRDDLQRRFAARWAENAPH